MKLKKAVKRGVCAVLGCKTKARTSRAKWCASHQKKIRKQQLKENNRAWYKRVAKGTAKHRLLYGGDLTEYAQSNPLMKRNALRRLAKETKHAGATS